MLGGKKKEYMINEDTTRLKDGGDCSLSSSYTPTANEQMRVNQMGFIDFLIPLARIAE